MLRHALLKFMVPAALLLGSPSAFAESRLALVIGQSAYRSVPALPNPANDARAVTQLLTDSGFEVSTASVTKSVRLRRPHPHPRFVTWTVTASIGSPVRLAAADCVPCGFCVGAQTSQRLARTSAVQFIGSIVACAR